ncbi:MAG: hypothetical protein R3E39_18935 [Anaerolineae bacterium]
MPNLLDLHRLGTRYWLLSTAFLLLLAACDTVLPPPTVTPGATLSGPGIVASPTVMPAVPTNIDFDAAVDVSNPTAAALAPDSAMPPIIVGTAAASGGSTAVIVTAQDGTALNGLFYQTGDGVRRPGVLLLADDIHGWADFPTRLHNAGFTVLVMPVRPQTMLQDFTVMLGAMSSGEADPASLAVVGAGDGADMALLGCAGDKLCDTVVLLSPSNNLALVEAINNYNPRPLLLAASQSDTGSFASAQSLQAAARGEVLLQPFENAGRGTDILLNRPDMGDLIIQWLQRQIGG